MVPSAPHASGLVTTLRCNADALLTNVTYSDANTPPVRYAFDNRNLMTNMADGWSTNSYRYDAQGRMTNLVEVFGTSTQTWGYAFDALGRATAVTWRITGNTNVFTTAYSFDEQGRVTNVAGDLGNFGYAYTNAGLQVSRLAYPNGETANYSYDSLARLTNLAYSTGEQWSYAYDARDFVTRRLDPATNVYAYAYDDAGRLIQATGLKGTNVVSGWPYRYGYDRAGNRIRQTEGQKQREIKVNANNQLIRSERTNTLSVRGYVNEPGSKVEVRNTASTNWYPASVRYLSQTQAYFEANNVLATNIYPLTNTILVRATDVANNISTSSVRVVSFGTATRFYAYDADGNQAYVIEGASQKYATWDAENRLIRIDYTDGNSRFRYDGWGRLREIAEYNSINTLTSLVRYAWNGFLPWAELNSTNGVIRTFNWGSDISGSIGGAGGIGGLVGIRSYIPGSNYFVRSNGRGNVTEVRRTNGTVAASYSYSPFGQLLTETNTYNQPFRLQSKLYHARSGYTAWPLRWYDWQAGRWLSRDAEGESSSLNLYAYAHQNPLSMHDPHGDIVPVLLVAWGAVELGLAIYDAYSTADTILDPCATTGEKWVAAGGFALGAVAPGGGYGAGGKRLFRHYGYAKDAAKFEKGLKPGAFGTHARGRPMSGKTAQDKLALPHETPPDSYYKVSVGDDVPVTGPSKVTATDVPPRSGGGSEYQFPQGTPPGSVEGPFGVKP